MGNWDISIKGVGIHHNGREDDVEQLAAEFVKKLKEKGQTVGDAKLTYGGMVDLEKPQQLLPIKKAE